MKCPACIEQGLRSRIDEHSGRTISPAGWKFERFYDEDGHLHVHDGRAFTTTFACTNNHAYERAVVSRCPHRLCSWNHNPLVKAGDSWTPGD